MTRFVAVFLLFVSAATLPLAQPPLEKLDYETIGRIRDEGLNRSQVMDHISWLADVYGPRLTGGPGIMQAGDWALAKFREWGLSNVHKETFPFGTGWALERFTAHMIEPQVQPLIGHPGAWSPGTNGTVVADVVAVNIQSEADFARYQGKLKDKIVLTQPARRVRMLEGLLVHRMDTDQFAEAMTTPVPPPRGRGGRGGRGDQNLRRKIDAFFKAEGVVAAFNRGGDNDETSIGSGLSARHQRTDGGTIFPSGGGSRSDAGQGVPTVTLAVEHYNRMMRILEKRIAVKVELNIQTRFFEETTPNGFNLVAEIPGTDPVLKDEVVLLGAHFDSVAYSPGATDNATGSAAMMEAMRILQAIGAKPRRTIRVALWGGEEEGLLGSRAYVREHYGSPETMELKPAHGKISVYFNSDNGSGRVRGIWLQENLAAAPIFRQWIGPLRDLGVEAVAPRSVSSTDHVAFDEVGIPAFQFMVDRLEYNSRSHHSNMDTVDRVQRDDMVQQATVIAILAWHAANRDERMPRKALPPPRSNR